MNFKKVAGTNNQHRVTVYALSTCGWCRKTKELLNRSNIEYQYTDVDLCTGEEKAEVVKRVQELNPRSSFPTIQIDNEVVVGFDEEKIKQLLGI